MDEVEIVNELPIESEFENVIIDTVLNEDHNFDDDIKCVVEEIEYDVNKSEDETSKYIDDNIISVETDEQIGDFQNVEHIEEVESVELINEVKLDDNSNVEKQNSDLIEYISFDSDIINDDESTISNCSLLTSNSNVPNDHIVKSSTIEKISGTTTTIENVSYTANTSPEDTSKKFNNIIIKNSNFPHFVKINTPTKKLDNVITTSSPEVKRPANMIDPKNIITKVFIGQNNSGKPFILPKSPIKITPSCTEIKNSPIKAITIAQAQQLGLFNTGKLQKIQPAVSFGSHVSAIVDVRPSITSAISPRIIALPNYTRPRALAPKILFKQTPTIVQNGQGSRIIKVPATTQATVSSTINNVQQGSNVNLNNKVQYIVITTAVSTPTTNAVVISLPNTTTVSSINVIKPVTTNVNNSPTAAEKIINSTTKKFVPIRPSIKLFNNLCNNVSQNGANFVVKNLVSGEVGGSSNATIVTTAINNPPTSPFILTISGSQTQTQPCVPVVIPVTKSDDQNKIKDSSKITEISKGLLPATIIDFERKSQLRDADHASSMKTFVFSKYLMPAGPFLTSGPTRARRPCNCTRSQCLKLYCECFANGDFCYLCNCNSCLNNIEHEENRQHAIRSCLDRNPFAFEPKINKRCNAITGEREHIKGCNCKRSNCLKNYCECYEAKVSCSINCKCVGCKNIDESMNDFECTNKRSYSVKMLDKIMQEVIEDKNDDYIHVEKSRDCYQLITEEVIDATCQCLMAQAAEDTGKSIKDDDDIRMIIEEFDNCLLQIIGSNARTKLNNDEDSDELVTVTAEVTTTT